MFIKYLESHPQWYLMVVATVVISIVLHELAHGWAAIWLGDDTPIHTNRMTGNPLVHMGPFSLVALFLCGIAWGQMLVDPSRLRGRHGDAIVSGAGPAMNLLLSALTLTGLGLWWRLGSVQELPFQQNLMRLLFIFGSTNLLLCLFNLMPVPPLDGSRLLASFHGGYANFVSDPAKQGLFIIMFMAVFALSGHLRGWVDDVSFKYTAALAGPIQYWEFVFP